MPPLPAAQLAQTRPPAAVGEGGGEPAVEKAEERERMGGERASGEIKKEKEQLTRGSRGG